MATRMDFSEWLAAELSQRGWHQAELVRRSGLSVGHVSRIITGQRLPGPDAITGIARALKMPAEEVMRQAGLLPMPADATVDDRKAVQELERKIKRLSAEERLYLIDLTNRLFPNAK